MFHHCLYPHAKRLAALILRLDSRFFDSDFDLIRYVAGKQRVEELATEIRLHWLDHPPRNFARRVLRLRLSGRKLLELGREVLAPAPPSDLSNLDDGQR